MTADGAPAGAGQRIEVALEELHAGASQLHDLAQEATSKLASSDLMLETSSRALKGLKSAIEFAAYAEFETARGKSAIETITAAAENVGYAAEHYHGTDESNAASLG
ncbi:hypothetical protein Srot_0055 [Segniliparus rotundus DSM 44985]|uniref:Uncharacterized protein n=1 Tax=Segniliparus rotundus (strain ATCC BAA-972 / CDC 1076 / CIP 108378 / DSM 44985 / JCM 13578) TaxID=640132 RepID=D6Z9M1_SEGRD|nr:hypothetical protein [Segniliparus rotundus]ADG96548.1 hypothetical protein Srot_0055 [Segniliparus rotundus DSM 44985]